MPPRSMAVLSGLGDTDAQAVLALRNGHVDAAGEGAAGERGGEQEEHGYATPRAVRLNSPTCAACTQPLPDVATVIRNWTMMSVVAGGTTNSP